MITILLHMLSDVGNMFHCVGILKAKFLAKTADLGRFMRYKRIKTILLYILSEIGYMFLCVGILKV